MCWYANENDCNMNNYIHNYLMIFTGYKCINIRNDLKHPAVLSEQASI